VTLTPHSLLVPWSRKGRAKHLPPPPVGRMALRLRTQSLRAYTKVHFIFYIPLLKYLANLSPEWETFRKKNVEKVKTNILYSVIFPPLPPKK
jgi:hypothetical protein